MAAPAPAFDRPAPTLKVLRITRRTLRPSTADSSVLGTEHEDNASDDSHLSSSYADLFYRPSPTPESKAQSPFHPNAADDHHSRALARGRSALAQPPLMADADNDDPYASFLDDMDMDYSSAVDIMSLADADIEDDADDRAHTLPLGVTAAHVKPHPRPPSYHPSNRDLNPFAWPDVPHTPITPITPTASYPLASDLVDDVDVLTSMVRPRSSSLALSSYFSAPDLRAGFTKDGSTLSFPHLTTSASENGAGRDSEPNTPTTFTSFLSTSSDGAAFNFSDLSRSRSGSGSTFASPSTSPSGSRNESRSCSSEQVRIEDADHERPLPATPWVLIDRCDEEERDARTPTPGPDNGLFARKSSFVARSRVDEVPHQRHGVYVEEDDDDQELNLPPSRFSLCSSAGTPPCKAATFRSTTTNQSSSSRFASLAKVRRAVRMPSKSSLKLSSSPPPSSREKKMESRARRISGMSARTAHTSCTAYTASSAHGSFVSTKSSASLGFFGARLRRLLGGNSVPPVPSLPPSPTAPTFASGASKHASSQDASASASSRTPAPSLRRAHASMPSLETEKEKQVSPVKSALAHLPTFKEKKRLVVRLLASAEDGYGPGRLSPAQEERALECIREWCSMYGALKRVSRKSPSPFVPYQAIQIFANSKHKYAMEVHVHFKTRNIAERVYRAAPTLHIPGAGYVELSYEGRR